MEEYLQTRLERQTSLRDWEPASVGEVLRPLAPGEDLLSEMLESGDD